MAVIGSNKRTVTFSGGNKTIHLNRQEAGSVNIYSRPSATDGWALLGVIDARMGNNIQFNINRPLTYLLKAESSCDVDSVTETAL